MNNILVTGASGFLGKSLIQYFDKRKIPTIPFSRKKGYEYEIFNTDFINKFKVKYILHLAGKAHDLKNTSNVQDYYVVNTDLTKEIFDNFLKSDAKVFITLSSVKAVADELDSELNEDYIPHPITHYGKSKLLADQYILSKQIPENKRVYILRPCMIHGPGNKGNLNLLYKIVKMGLPWPLGSFENKRSFCSIDNLCFIVNELIENDQVPSGIYNIADDEPVSTNQLIELISESLGKKVVIWNTSQFLIRTLSKLGDILGLPLNSERLSKLTETYIVSNKKIKNVINKPLPVRAKDGLLITINSFINA